jgi:RNA polymerase sigma-70 factor (ECF subfamily)
VELIARRSEAALAELFDATSPRVYGLARRILRDPAAAEEATLDVYAQVWRDAGRYDSGKGSVAAWLLTLARSRAIDLLRSRERRAETEAPLEPAEAMIDDAAGPEEASLESERARQVRRALAALPADQRRALEAAYFRGLSHTEVAAALGQPLGTIKTRIRTGLLALRRALGPEAGEESA